jgi:hypothetical protein
VVDEISRNEILRNFGDEILTKFYKSKWMKFRKILVTKFRERKWTKFCEIKFTLALISYFAKEKKSTFAITLFPSHCSPSDCLQNTWWKVLTLRAGLFLQRREDDEIIRQQRGHAYSFLTYSSIQIDVHIRPYVQVICVQFSCNEKR